MKDYTFYIPPILFLLVSIFLGVSFCLSSRYSVDQSTMLFLDKTIMTTRVYHDHAVIKSWEDNLDSIKDVKKIVTKRMAQADSVISVLKEAGLN